jgi:hypothetical protein
MENNFENEENLVVEDSVIFAPKITEEAELKEDLNSDVALEQEPVDYNQEPLQAEPVEEVQALGTVNGAIGVTKTKPKQAKSQKTVAEKKDTVAIRSTKNVSWSGVGKIHRGINIVEKSIADQWLTRSHVTVATPEEVAKEFGK